ncbi:MAG: hypothetical protein KDC49_16155 [Saprospiraceae bacterium]|nr:hypothetical protein [Saprospiraceae bacterium]
MKNNFYTILSLFYCILFSSLSLNAQVFVKWDATGANNGTSWANAYTDLQMAIDSNVINKEIWVAQGTYYPVSDLNGNYGPADLRSKTFHGRVGFSSSFLRMYGGFNGTETALNQRNPSAYPTILSGVNNNCYHVFTLFNNTYISNQIDGFQITGGNANGPQTGEQNGAGFYVANSNIKIVNSQLHYNTAIQDGGAIYSENSFLRIENTTLNNNNAMNGGAVFTLSSVCTFNGNKFLENTAGTNGGACMINDDLPAVSGGFYSSELYRNLFQSNSAGLDGGGLYRINGKTATVCNSSVFKTNYAVQGAAFVIKNSVMNYFNLHTIVDNQPNTGNSGVYVQNSTGEIDHCILWENGTNELVIENSTSFNFRNSLIKNAFVSVGPSSEILSGIDPKFVNYPNDLHLLPISPCINYKSFVSSGSSSNDIDNTLRKKGPRFDMGAYEFDPSTCAVSNRVYIDINAGGNEIGDSWMDAMRVIDDGFYLANACPSVGEVWIADGFYTPNSNAGIDHAFEIKSSLGIFGGFKGLEISLNDRVLDTNFTTIISGDIGVINEVTDNSRNLFKVSDSNVEIKLDGLTMQDAYNPLANGGACYFRFGKTTISHCIFKKNIARNGGAVYSVDSKIQVNDSQFMQNFVGQDGGGIFTFADTTIVSNCIFSRNEATRNGGAIVASVGVNFYGENLFVLENKAANNGGGLFISNANAEIVGYTSYYNKARNGGSIHALFGQFNMSDATFDLDSSFSGGCLYLGSIQGSVDHITAMDITATFGPFLNSSNSQINFDSISLLNIDFPNAKSLFQIGSSTIGIHNLIAENNISYGFLDAQNSSYVIDSIFLKNNNFERCFTHYGAGSCTISSSKIENNVMNPFFFGSELSLAVDKVKFLNNSGEMFYIYNATATNVANCLFSFNELSGLFSYFSFQNVSQVNFINNVVYGLTSFASNKYLFSGDASILNIANSIFRQNPGILFIQFASTSMVYNNIIQGGYLPGANILDVDPKFVNPGAGDFNLLMGSPAINTGSPVNAPLTDILGNPRPQGGFYDMGIHEYSLPAQFVFHGAIDNDWHKGGNWDTGFPPPNVYQGNVFMNADANKVDGIGFEIFSPGVLIIGNGVEVKF